MSSIPPLNVSYLQKFNAQVNHHPLVHTSSITLPLITHTLLQNPLHFLFHAATVYPDKLALAHPDVDQPVFYTYAVW